jgi:PEP-CTERM motif-containing protein
MKKIVSLTLSLAAISALNIAHAQTTIADWTFETSQPGVVTLPAAPGAGVAFTGFSPEVGSGTASALHAGASTYSSPSGDGSSHSFSSNVWTNNGDYYQFAVNTTGFTNITLSFEQISSATGPKDFSLQYSSDGSSYTPFASYSIITGGNAGINTWSNSIYEAQSAYSFNLSSITAIANDSTVDFRLTVSDQNSANGGTVATGGTDRIDDLLVSGTSISVPEPSTLALAAMGLAGCLIAFRRRSN